MQFLPVLAWHVCSACMYVYSRPKPHDTHSSKCTNGIRILGWNTLLSIVADFSSGLFSSLSPNTSCKVTLRVPFYAFYRTSIVGTCRTRLTDMHRFMFDHFLTKPSCGTNKNRISHLLQYTNSVGEPGHLKGVAHMQALISTH